MGLKQGLTKRALVRSKAELRNAANKHVALLERTHKRVIAYLQDRCLRYAA